MFGGGIYVILGKAAGIIGPALILAFMVTGILTVFILSTMLNSHARFLNRVGGTPLLTKHSDDFQHFSQADFSSLANVNASVIELHEKGLSVPGTFRSRFYPLIPILSVVTCFLLVLSLEQSTLVLGYVLTLIGFAMYLGYGRRKKEKHKCTERVLYNGTEVSHVESKRVLRV